MSESQKDMTPFVQPRWKPIGQYRTCPLPILPILPVIKYTYRYKQKNPLRKDTGKNKENHEQIKIPS